MPGEMQAMNSASVRWPPSLWAAVTPPAPDLPELTAPQEAEVVVIGAGFTGLSTALHLREAGVDVAVVEAMEPGWGASGRNNGQVIPTLSRPDPDDIIAKHGAAGERFVHLLRDSASILFEVAARYRIDAEQEQTGWVQPVHSPGRIKIAERRVRQWSKFGAPVELLSREQVRDMLGSEAWFGGFWNKSGGHINPLALSRGLAHAAMERGVRIYARSPATNFHRRSDGWLVQTGKGEISGRALVVATNAYSGEISKSLVPEIAREVMPVLSWQMATQPLSDNVRNTVIPGRQAMSDTHGELYFARYDARHRLGHRRRCDRPRQQGGAAEGARHRAAAAALAADRRDQVRPCLERLCRHDHGFFAAHSSPRARRLWLDRMQRPRGGAVDRAGTGIVEGRARRAGQRIGAAVYESCADRRPRPVAQARAADAAALSQARCARDDMRCGNSG